MTIPRLHPQALIRAASVLKKGGVAVLPCDTIYGIVGVAPETRDRILDLKGRDEHRPFLMLVADPSWIKPFSDAELPLTLRPFWPGPLTVLFPGKSGGKTGFRMPEDPFLTKILALLGKPLFSTSVNVAGRPHLWKSADIVREFGSRVDLVVDAGDLPEGVPSTVVDITVSPFRLVRQGALHLPERIFN